MGNELRAGLRGCARVSSGLRLSVAFSFILLVALTVGPPAARADCANAGLAADAAIAACSRVIQAGTLSGHALADAYDGRGGAHTRKAEFDLAVDDFSEAIKLDPYFALAWRNRADAWLRKGDRDRAISDYGSAIALDPKDAFAVARRADVWRLKGDLDSALDGFNQAIALAPTFAAAYGQRSLIYWAKGDLDHAIADDTEAIRYDPKLATSFNNRGMYLDQKGDHDRAIADFDEAIRLVPSYAHAWRNRGDAFENKGDHDHAMADYNEAIRLDPKDAPTFTRRAVVLAKKGSVDGALADYNEAIRLNASDPVNFNNRGRIFRSRGDTDRAISDFSEAIRLDPAYTGALTDRGLAYEAKGDVARARADFQAAAALPPKYSNGPWALDTAKSRLAVLAPPPAVAPATPATANIVLPKGPTGSRLALVIGNGAYRNAPQLPNPPNDARAVAKTLRDIGFQVIEGTDLDRGGMEKALLEFLQRAPTASVRLLFYAGHGISIDGNNYLVPIDAMVATKSAAMFELIDIDRILKGLDDEARANVVILDACRDNPFEPRLMPSRSTRGSGLVAYQTVGSGTLIAFATAPGNTAADGTGTHSPFTTALLKYIGTSGMEVNQMLTRVRIDVATATERKQIPWVNSSLLGDVYLGAEQHPKR
ncbi:MAG: tetratricopeptide repeat protein [Xanthobacteraceae bacterium]|nr:tetratricopeptide repeat protein [Xanthobacteraceae bacterium]